MKDLEKIKNELILLEEEKKDLLIKVAKINQSPSFLVEDNKKTINLAKEEYQNRIDELDAKILEYNKVIESFYCASVLQDAVKMKPEIVSENSNTSEDNKQSLIESLSAMIFTIILCSILLSYSVLNNRNRIQELNYQLLFGRMDDLVDKIEKEYKNKEDYNGLYAKTLFSKTKVEEGFLPINITAFKEMGVAGYSLEYKLSYYLCDKLVNNSNGLPFDRIKVNGKALTEAQSNISCENRNNIIQLINYKKN